MLSKETFNDGIEKLVIEYGDRGFEMTEEKATQWFEFFKNLSNEIFLSKIDSCLKTCIHIPFMADLYQQENKKSSLPKL